MINPSVVEGQIAGGAVQGIGGALLEDFVYDADGNPLTTTFLDYLLPTAADIPTLEYGHIETPGYTPATTRASAKAAPSGHRRRSPTPSTTPSPLWRACSKRPSAPHASWPPWRQSDAERHGGRQNPLHIR